MREDKNTVLIVEDQEINRMLLQNMIHNTYSVLEAANGKEALEILEEKSEEIVAILLDIVMPVMDGFEFLKRIQKSDWDGIPVIAMTGDSSWSTEEKTLELGAWDFIVKPYKEQVLMTRLRNAIARSKMNYLKQMKHMAEHDYVTGLYNRLCFFRSTEEMLREYASREFVFIRIDIKRFRLINSYWGEKGGDKVLCFIADTLRSVAPNYPCYSYGRIESDIFGLCIPYERNNCKVLIDLLVGKIRSYSERFILEPSFGIYLIEDNLMPAETMFIFATMANKKVKNQYQGNVGIYDEKLGRQIMREQDIYNDMGPALQNEEFVLFFQPKYDCETQRPYGAEALVRWEHPQKGMLSPAIFIPVFEKNGFVEKLDYYVWEKACQHLRRWIDEGNEPAPISVNMSRIDCSNSGLPERLSKLVEKYGIPPELLHLELTESAYMDNPAFINNMIMELRRRGFYIMIDDFGSGYSSLNTLKDIQVDYLKLDMKFLFSESDDDKSKKILTAVVTMAQSLHLKIVAEGVETKEQFEFLRSIHCDYIQGYYFCRPVPSAEYEKIAIEAKK
ncbi:MAG: EAL domain-containing protein [Eubacteriales bacterium]|nr:EAL domain-containing protein [Eubacteriales bacterium]